MRLSTSIAVSNRGSMRSGVAAVRALAATLFRQVLQVTSSGIEDRMPLPPWPQAVLESSPAE